jgi:hypothetical protein
MRFATVSSGSKPEGDPSVIVCCEMLDFLIDDDDDVVVEHRLLMVVTTMFREGLGGAVTQRCNNNKLTTKD